MTSPSGGCPLENELPMASWQLNHTGGPSAVKDRSYSFSSSTVYSSASGIF